MAGGSEKIGSGPSNTISLDAYRRMRQSAGLRDRADPATGHHASSTYELVMRPPMTPPAAPGKILGAGRWNEVHVDPDRLPYDDGEDDGGVARPTTPPPVLPEEYRTEPVRPDFALLEKASRDLNIEEEGEVADRRRMKAYDIVDRYEETFSAWWHATYMMLVYHAASRAGRGGRSEELSHAFHDGQLIPLSSDASSPHEASLASRLDCLRQGLAVSVPHVRLEVVSRSALILEHIKYTMSGDEQRPIAIRLRDACAELLGTRLDERDRVMAAIALQRIVTVIPDIRTAEDIGAIAETYLSLWTTADTADNIGMLEAMQDLVGILSRSAAELPIDNLIERMRQAFTYVARRADSDFIKRVAHDGLAELNKRFEPPRHEHGFEAPAARIMRADSIFRNHVFSRDRSRPLESLEVYFDMRRMARTYDNARMSFRMGRLLPSDADILVREAYKGDTASRAIAAIVLGYVAANKIHPEELFTHVVPIMGVLNLTVPDLATGPFEAVRVSASLITSGHPHAYFADNQRPIERIDEAMGRVMGGLSERKRAGDLDDAAVSRAFTIMGAELLPFAVRSYRELLGRIVGERAQKYEMPTIDDAVLRGVHGMTSIAERGIAPHIRQQAHKGLTSLNEQFHLSTRFAHIVGLLPVMPPKGFIK